MMTSALHCQIFMTKLLEQQRLDFQDNSLKRPLQAEYMFKHKDVIN